MERHSLTFYMKGRECLSIEREEIHLLYTKERHSLLVIRKVALLFI